MSQSFARWIGFAGICCGVLSAIAPRAAWADVALRRADVEALQNRVEFLPQNGVARPAQLSDWLDLGDAIRTAQAARVDLRFNDGSLARIGERATFRFVPNTRTFQLSNGTALFLIPPGQGPSTIETPGTVTGIQGTALVVRHIPFATGTTPAAPGGIDAPGRTVVMVLTDNPDGPVNVSLPDGRSADLNAGQLAIVDRGNLYVFDFDLALFYETSPLVDDLRLDDPDYSGSGQPTDPVRQETLQGLSNQGEFAGEYFLNPTVLSPQAAVTPGTNWLVPLSTADEISPPRETAPTAPPSTSTPNDTTSSEPATPPEPMQTEPLQTHGGSQPGADLVPPGSINSTPDNVPSGGATGPSSNFIPPGLINPTPGNVPGPPDDVPGPPDDVPGPPDDVPGPPDDVPGPPDDVPGPPDDVPGPPDDVPPAGNTITNP